MAAAILVILASTIVSLGFRTRHFQELDSYMVADFFQAPREKVIDYTLTSYQPSSWGAAKPQGSAGALAAPAIRRAPDWVIQALGKTDAFRSYYARQNGGASPPAAAAPLRAFMFERAVAEPQLARLPPHAIYRLGLLTAISAAPLPKIARNALLLPLATTYSIGPGLLYSVLDYASGHDPNRTMANATALTVVIFHLTAATLLITLLQLRVSPLAASLATIWFLFASSLYGYGFHLGSTVWMMGSSAIFLMVATSGVDHARKVRLVGIATGVLIFFSYLVIVYYLAFVLIDAWDRAARMRVAKSRERISIVLEFARDHVWAWAGILVCMVLFYQPGQGIRGAMRSLGEAPTYLGYIALNLFGFSDGRVTWPSSAAPIVQVTAALAILALGALGVGRSAKTDDHGARAIAVYLPTLATVYGLFCVAGMLSLAPTRHLLFLAPAIFLLLGYGLNVVCGWLAGRLPTVTAPVGAGLAILLMAAWGFWVQQGRFVEVTAPKTPPISQSYAGATGNHAPTAWSVGLRYIPPTQVAQAASPLLYVDSDCDAACFQHRLEANPQTTGRWSARALSPPQVGTGAKMMAFIPPFADERFAFDRRNRLFLARVEALPTARRER